MSKEIRKTFYLGDDLDYLQEGQKTLHKYSNGTTTYEFIPVTPEKDLSLFELLKRRDCLLVIFDFTHKDADTVKWLRQLIYLRRHQFMRQVVFAGIFKDKMVLEEISDTLLYGLNYFHVKGNDIAQFFNDCTYISYDVQSRPALFARVKDLALPYHLKMSAIISRVMPESIRVNCDANPTLEELVVSYRFLDSERRDSFPINNYFETAESGHAMNSYEISFPIKGPWDRNEGDLTSDEIKAFYDSESLCLPPRNIMVYTEDDDVFEKLVNLPQPLNFTIHFEQLTLKERIHNIKPELIIIDLPQKHSSDYKSFFWEFIIELKKESEFEPLLIIFNSPVSTGDFRSEFNYSKVLSHKEPCKFETLDLMLNVYMTKHLPPVEDSEYKVFHISDRRSFCEIEVPILVTSLSEHEITFYSDKELAMYSILKLDAPIDCYVVIVPPYWNLHRREGKFHHMGLIMGIDHDESIEIRNFVNQAIFKPLKKFEKQIIDPQLPKPTETQHTQTELVSEPVIPEIKPIKRNTYKRSKL